MERSTEKAQRPLGLLIDMDGTLTVPLLDFAAIKGEIGIDGRPILESIAAMQEYDRKRAEQILDRHETDAARASTLNPGCRPLLAWCADQAIEVAVITRNSRACCDLVLERHGIDVATSITRDDGPHKPDAWPLLEGCRRLDVTREEVWMVGDGHFDIEAAEAADITSVWISHGRQRAFDATPTMVDADLIALLDRLQRTQPLGQPRPAERVR